MAEIDQFLLDLSSLGKKYKNDEAQLQKEAEVLLQKLRESGNPFISHVLQEDA